MSAKLLAKGSPHNKLTPPQARARDELRQQHFQYFDNTEISRAFFTGYGKKAFAELNTALVALNQDLPLPTPSVIEVHPVPIDCNARCPRCISYKLIKESKQTIPNGSNLYFSGPEAEERGRNIVRQAADLWTREGTKGEIKNSGSHGDPMQYAKVSLAMLKEADIFRDTMTLLMFTNSLEIRSFLSLRLYEYLDYLYFSLDGATPRTIAKTKGKGREYIPYIKDQMRLIKHLCKTKPINLGVFYGYVINRINFHETIMAIDTAEELGFTGIRFRYDYTDPQFFFDHRKEVAAQEAAIREISERRGSIDVLPPTPPFITPPFGYWPGHFFMYCLFHLITLTISKWGTAHSCFHDPTSVPNPLEENLGNLRTDTLEKIAKGDKRREASFKYPAKWCSMCPSSAWILNYWTAYHDHEKLLNNRFFREDLKRIIGRTSG